MITGLEDLLAQVGDRLVTNMKHHAHVDTGRMEASIRRRDVVFKDGKLSVTAVVGGTIELGRLREIGIPGIVDYAPAEIARHPEQIPLQDLIDDMRSTFNAK